MPRETDCGCCEAQRAFVVCYECGKGDKKSVPLCKDCSSFIHRGLLSGHQISSVSRHNDRDSYDRGSPATTQLKTETGFSDSRSSHSKGQSDSNYTSRNESAHSSSKYSERSESRSGNQNRSSSNYTSRKESRSAGYGERGESQSVPQAASSSIYAKKEILEETVEDVLSYQESELASNGFDSTDFVRTSDFPASRTHQNYNNRNSVNYSTDRVGLREAVVSSTYPTHQPLPSLPNHERGRPGVYPLLPKVRYMDDEIFKVEVNSSLHPDGTFWAALVRTEEEEDEFKRFEDDLRHSASSASPCEQLERDTEVLADVKNTWCRAKVEYDIDSSDYKIRQTDYGSSARANQSQLKNLPLKFYTVPYQALRCCIASKEVEKFDRDSQNLFQSMTEQRILVAQVIQCDTQNKTFYVKLLQNEENGVEQINISERVLQTAAISLGRALQITKAPDLRVTKYFSSESNKDDVLEVKLSGDSMDSGNRKRPMVMIAQRPKVLRGTVMPKTDKNGEPRCFHCNHYGHFAKFCPRKTCRGWKRKI